LYHEFYLGNLLDLKDQTLTMNIGEQNKDYIFLDDIRGYTPVDND
jgi:hypothetical protein